MDPPLKKNIVLPGFPLWFPPKPNKNQAKNTQKSAQTNSWRRVLGSSEDIFSLGVVFFQLMTARVPRSGSDKVQGIFQEPSARSVCLPPFVFLFLSFVVVVFSFFFFFFSRVGVLCWCSLLVFVVCVCVFVVWCCSGFVFWLCFLVPPVASFSSFRCSG